MELEPLFHESADTTLAGIDSRLLIGAIWDHCGIHIFGTSGIYGGVARANVGIFAVQPRLSASVMIGNALFLQDILTPTFGSNGPLWSLSYEFWYYVLFPLMLLAVPLGKVNWSTALFAIATFMVAFFIGETICLYFLIWLLGASINLAPERPGGRGSLWIVVGRRGSRVGRRRSKIQTRQY